ncbi:hypothetical protein CPTSV76_017 [Enterobacteria phage SV76]|nr:hypothetical protein CPTSV76_017 [Enterobacteria phage SV76]
MNKLEIVNEIRRCAEPTQEGWDIWYHSLSWNYCKD